jgi:1-deoxy-D-xylulose-5-phosphate synthase
MDLRFAAPIDWQAVDGAMAKYSLMVVAEDGYVTGGVGESIAARASSSGARCRVYPVGVGSKYITHATRGEQLEEQGLTASGITCFVEELYGRNTAASG